MTRLALQTPDRCHLHPDRHGWHAITDIDHGHAEAWHPSCQFRALALSCERARLGQFIKETPCQSPSKNST